MEEPNLKDKSQTNIPTLEELIKREWEIIEDFQIMLKDKELTVTEKTRVASVYAFHINTLSRLLARKGENNLFEDQNLGDFVRGVEPRIARRFRRDFRLWQRITMSRR
jgi:hypothetical protein